MRPCARFNILLVLMALLFSRIKKKVKNDAVYSIDMLFYFTERKKVTVMGFSFF